MLTELVKKLHIKPGQKIALIDVPEEFINRLNPLPQNVKVSKELQGSFDLVQIFAVKLSQIEDVVKTGKNILNENGTLWFAYPKKSSNIESDITRDKAWPVFEAAGYRPVAMISIDETWSDFACKQGTAKQKAEKPHNKISEALKFIDVKNRIIIPPADLMKAFDKNKKAEEFFSGLSFTNKKEFIAWILDAKKEETRIKRVDATIEKLQRGLKNPSAK